MVTDNSWSTILTYFSIVFWKYQIRPVQYYLPTVAEVYPWQISNHYRPVYIITRGKREQLYDQLTNNPLSDDSSRPSLNPIRLFAFAAFLMSTKRRVRFLVVILQDGTAVKVQTVSYYLLQTERMSGSTHLLIPMTTIRSLGEISHYWISPPMRRRLTGAFRCIGQSLTVNPLVRKFCSKADPYYVTTPIFYVNGNFYTHDCKCTF